MSADTAPQFRSIAFLRALAAFWVLTDHCMIWGGWHGIPIPSAKYAVDLFMMISGFLMVANAEARLSIEPLHRHPWRFWLRRYMRIAPAYYVSLALAVITAPLFIEGLTTLRAINPATWQFDTLGIYDPTRIDYSVRNIALHLSFVFGLLPDWSNSTLLPDWSLSLEMQFYAAFPLLFWLTRKYGGWSIVIMAVACAWLSSLMYAYPEPSLLVFKLPQFAAGMLAFGARNWTARALAVACASLDGTSIPALLICAMLALNHIESWGKLPALLKSKVIAFASDTSYSVYLFHMFLIAACGLALARYPQLREISPALRVAIMFAVVAPATYAVAWVMFRCVERPGIELGRRLAARRRYEVSPSL